MTIEDSIVEVDRLLHIGQVGRLHRGVAIIDPRPKIVIAAIVLGLEASTSEMDWRSRGYGCTVGSGDVFEFGNGYGHGSGHGNGNGYGYGYGNGDGDGDGYGNGDGGGYGFGRSGGNGYGHG